MNEEQFRREVQHMIRKLGFDDYHPPDTQFASGATVLRGRPDIFGLNPAGPTIVIEVKAVQSPMKKLPHFNPKAISNAQRNWLDWWEYMRHGAGYLAIGFTGRPRRLFMIPWEAWVQIEQYHYEESGKFPTFIPIAAMAYHECTWFGSGIWQLPAAHSMKVIETNPHEPGDWEFAPISLRQQED